MSQLFKLLVDQEDQVKGEASKLLGTLDKVQQLRQQTRQELKYGRITRATYTYRMKQYDEIESGIHDTRNQLLTKQSILHLLRGVIQYEKNVKHA